MGTVNHACFLGDSEELKNKKTFDATGAELPVVLEGSEWAK